MGAGCPVSPESLGNRLLFDLHTLSTWGECASAEDIQQASSCTSLIWTRIQPLSWQPAMGQRPPRQVAIRAIFCSTSFNTRRPNQRRCLSCQPHNRQWKC